jgi:hypothetical protein
VTDQEDLALFCAQLPTLRRMFKGPASAAARATVEQAAAAARAGRPIGSFLAELGLDAGPAEPATHHSTREGPPTRVHTGLSGPVSGVYVCPDGTCRRAETRAAGGALPTCGVHERALRFVADD